VRETLREGVDCDSHELTPALTSQPTLEINSTAGWKDADSKPDYPEGFIASDYKKLIKKVENYVDALIVACMNWP
jgi:hypothetical protein